MLITPFGTIRVFVNNTETSYTYEPLPTNHRFPDVDGRYQINIGSHTESCTIRCIIPTFTDKASPETGERFEAVAFYQNGVKLTLGTVANFEEQSGNLLSNGIEVTTNKPVTEFGICWMNNATEENDHQTWFGADLYMNNRI